MDFEADHDLPFAGCALDAIGGRASAIVGLGCDEGEVGEIGRETSPVARQQRRVRASAACAPIRKSARIDLRRAATRPIVAKGLSARERRIVGIGTIDDAQPSRRRQTDRSVERRRDLGNDDHGRSTTSISRRGILQPDNGPFAPHGVIRHRHRSGTFVSTRSRFVVVPRNSRMISSVVLPLRHRCRQSPRDLHASAGAAPRHLPGRYHSRHARPLAAIVQKDTTGLARHEPDRIADRLRGSAPDPYWSLCRLRSSRACFMARTPVLPK